MFKDLNYKQYAIDNKLDILLKIDLKDYGDITRKNLPENPNYSVTEGLTEPFPVELDDLIRLHYLVRKYKVITVMEIGPGKSTIVFADAIRRNKEDYSAKITGKLRKNNPFEVHSIETSKEWANVVERSLPDELSGVVTMHKVNCEMTEFNGRICTTFDFLPNICPDFIYLDGPDQFSVDSDIGGISTRHPDRMPMVCDLLKIEHFLLPGTIIVVDGRTANANFMLKNFQLDWEYKHYPELDIHIFINKMNALGAYNQRELNFKREGAI